MQMAGHSLGEYTALVCAGSVNFADALTVVKRRSELMQGAVPVGEGAMAAAEPCIRPLDHRRQRMHPSARPMHLSPDRAARAEMA